MTYFKITTPNNELSGTFELINPIFVRIQNANGIYVRCSKRDACGVISPDGEKVYTLFGKSFGEGADSEERAKIISLAEYEECLRVQEQNDIEDDSPQLIDDTPIKPIMTRAELTQRVEELEEQNRFLQDCLLEMSEIVYQ